MTVNGRIITDFPFLDYVVHEIRKPKSSIRQAGYLPKTVLGIKETGSRSQPPDNNDPVSYEYAPLVDLTRFSDWNDYLRYLDLKNHKFLANTFRLKRKIVREQNRPLYNFHTSDPDMLEKCISWKLRQCQMTGSTLLFSDPGHIRFFRSLLEQKKLIISLLHISGKPLAISVGISENQCYYGLLSGYDPTFAVYAPGRLLLIYILEQCLKRKYREVNFLLGPEAYKWYYATHYRIIGSVGIPPVSTRILIMIRRLQFLFRSKAPSQYYRLKKTVINISRTLKL